MERAEQETAGQRAVQRSRFSGMKSSLNMSSEVTVDIHMVLSKQAAIPACAQEGSSGTGATRPQRMKSPRKERETGENLQERDAKRGASSGRGSLPALSPSSRPTSSQTPKMICSPNSAPTYLVQSVIGAQKSWQPSQSITFMSVA